MCLMCAFEKRHIKRTIHEPANFQNMIKLNLQYLKVKPWFMECPLKYLWKSLDTFFSSNNLVLFSGKNVDKKMIASWRMRYKKLLRGLNVNVEYNRIIIKTIELHLSHNFVEIMNRLVRMSSWTRKKTFSSMTSRRFRPSSIKLMAKLAKTNTL